MAKTKVEILVSEYSAYCAAAEISGVTIIDNPKKKIVPVRLGDQMVCVVSYRDPFYLMKWVRTVYQLAREQQIAKQEKKK